MSHTRTGTLAMVLAEAAHRRWTTLLAVAAVALPTALLVISVAAASALADRTRQIQRDIGQNIVVLPGTTALDRYFTNGYADADMPEDSVVQLENQAVINRFIGRLTKPVTIASTSGATATLLLTGMTEERFNADERGKPVFTRGRERIPEGMLVLGADAAAALNAKVDQELLVNGLTMLVDEILAGRSGTAEDAMVFASLRDAQAILGLEGRISEIHALECMECTIDPDEFTADLAAAVQAVLPGVRVVRQDAAANARQNQRQLLEGFLRVVTPVVLVISGLWIATLAMMNAAARRDEVGVLRALGYAAAPVLGLFLGRAALVGLLGAAAGLALGLAATQWAGPAALDVPVKALTVPPPTLAALALAGVAFAVVASGVPAWIGSRRDPAALLREG